MEQRMYSILVELPFLFTSVAFWNASKNRSGWMKVMRLLVTWLCSNCPLQVDKLGNCLNRYITFPVIIEVHTLWLVDKYIISRKNIHIAKLPLVLHEETKNSCMGGYNLGQNCWENCKLGQHFSKHRSCTGSSLCPFPWKQCCCVFKRKPDPWAFVGSNIELGEGVFFRQRRRFGNSFVA